MFSEGLESRAGKGEALGWHEVKSWRSDLKSSQPCCGLKSLGKSLKTLGMSFYCEAKLNFLEITSLKIFTLGLGSVTELCSITFQPHENASCPKSKVFMLKLKNINTFEPSSRSFISETLTVDQKNVSDLTQWTTSHLSRPFCYTPAVGLHLWSLIFSALLSTLSGWQT